MKRKKSLCKSCSNRVIIKYHGKNIRPGNLEGEYFYNFCVSVSDSRYHKHTNGAESYDSHVSYVIVDECSFYNKYNVPLKRNENKKGDNESDDDIDDGGERNSANGVTFVNIPGALLP